MAAGYVPTSPLNTFYSNSTPGTVASPDAIDGALQAVVQTVNDNYDAAVTTNTSLNTHKNAAVLDHPDQSVTTAKIKDVNVTTAKLADLAVSTAKIADAGVTGPKIAPASITAAHIATGATSETINGARLDAVDAQLADIAIDVLHPPSTLTAILGNGSDETAALSALINYVADNHYTLFIPRHVTISIDFITITSKQNFGIRCEGTIKRLNSSPTIGALLKLDTCSNVSIPVIRFDGNGPNNGCVENVAYTSSQEQKHTLILSNCTDVRVNDFSVNNACGDGIYITGGSKNLSFETVKATADTQIGRNVVTLINCQDLYFGYIYGDNFGHYDMPGGFDIEPNLVTDVVKNIFVGAFSHKGGGTNPFSSLFGVNVATVENLYVDSINMIRTNAVSPAGEVQSVLLCTNNIHIGKVSIINATAYNINGITIQNYAGSPKGIFVNESYLKNVYRGLQIGFSASNVEDIRVKATIRDVLLDGVNIGTCKNVLLDIDINSVGSSRYMINKSGTGLTAKVKIRGDISKRGTGTAAMISSSDPSTIVDWTLENLDFTGWTSDGRLYGGGWQGSVRKMNCPNLTLMNSKPNFEQWKIGDIIYNTNPVETGTAGSKYIIDKWIATANGDGATALKESRVLTGN